MPNWVFDLDLIKHGPIVQLHEQCISDRALFRIVVLNAEAAFLDAVDLGAECIDAWISGRLVRAEGAQRPVSGRGEKTTEGITN